LGDMLERISIELQTLEASMEEMHPIVERLVQSIPPGEFGSMLAMQNIDRIEQTLSSLAMFLRAVAAETPLTWSLDVGPAAATVRLADLAHRLSSQEPHQPATDTEDAGDCEMF
jgi:hypothetical protein